MNTPPDITTSNPLAPAASAASLLKTYGQHTTELATIRTALAKQAEQVRQGNPAVVEDMPLSQAVALNSIFVHHAAEAAKPVSWLQHQQTHLSLALKAQARAQATLQTLVNMKPPRQVAATFPAGKCGASGVDRERTANTLPNDGECSHNLTSALKKVGGEIVRCGTYVEPERFS